MEAQTGWMFSPQQEHVETCLNGIALVSCDVLKIPNFLSVGVYDRHSLLPSLTYPYFVP